MLSLGGSSTNFVSVDADFYSILSSGRGEFYARTTKYIGGRVRVTDAVCIAGTEQRGLNIPSSMDAGKKQDIRAVVEYK